MITVKAPGKLYIAGEYSVVESSFSAVIVALNQFVTVSIEASEKFGSIVSKQYSENSLVWRRQGSEMIFDNRDNPFHYILSAMQLTEEYAQSLHHELGIYHLNVNSDLDSPDGKKYGLGSSAAVTVATIKALCEFYHLPVSQDQLFKLAAIAHLDVQGNGSLGDIAASVYGGWIAYRSFDHQWLAVKRRSMSLAELVSTPWPGLNVELLTPPADLQLMIGWTKSPASTSHLVDKVSLAKSEHPEQYQAFLDASRACIHRMVEGFRTKDLGIIKTEIETNRQLLQQLADLSHVAIETPLLTTLCTIANHYHGAAKTSGAGGGDCGIVIIDQHADTAQLRVDWEEAGIEPLNLSVHHVKE